MTKYQALAQHIRQQIQNDIWTCGEKLPSLRQQAEQAGVSLMTVVQAYQLLESQGWVISQARSGYIVTEKTRQDAESTTKAAEENHGKVDINDFIFEVLKTSRQKDIFPLGSVYPDSSLYPDQQVNKSLIAATRSMSAADTLDNFPPGNETLRKIIAKRYAAQGMSVHPDEIVITAGAMDALNLSLQAVTQTGDWVIVESPAFYGALQAIQRLNLRALPINVCPKNGLDFNALEIALKNYPVKACWLMTNFQNPTGFSMSDIDKKNLVRILSEADVSLIEDDVYNELYIGDEKPIPAKIFDQQGKVLHCSSFSKSLISGFRIGWVAAGGMSQTIQKLQLMSTLSVSTPIQLALANYLTTRNYQQHLQKLRKKFHANKLKMHKLLQYYLPEQVKIHSSSGGYFLWIELPQQLDATSLYFQALESGISIAPGKMFSALKQHQNCFRINCSFADHPDIQRVLEKLSELIMDMQ